jgi:hypothetical protein
MKVALCLHGLFDSLTDSNSKGIDGYQHIKKHILDKTDTDVFIHSWEENKSDEINSLYNPKKAVYDEQVDFNPLIQERGLHHIPGCPRPPFSVLSHLYSVTQAMKLPYEYDEYDIIIKARFDLGRINRRTSGPGAQNPYPVQCINFKFPIEEDKIYMANWNHFHMGPADMWFYGSPEVMKPFTKLYSDLENSFHMNSEFHQFATKIEGNFGDISNAIAFYKYWMLKNGLWEKRELLETEWE